MIYIRGFPNNFAYWSDQLGNTDWSYDKVLPYYLKSEGNQHAPFVQYQNGKYHSGSGPWKINFFPPDGTKPLQKIFLDAAVEKGYPLIPKINADQYSGYLIQQAYVNDGRRQSTAEAFLLPAKSRKNLHIIKHAFVEKILIDKHNKAYGVKFSYKKKHNFTAIARKGVILSAGAIMSPIILMRSGIGSPRQLKQFKISTKACVPGVGANLWDHLYAFTCFQFNPTETPANAQLDAQYQYLMHNDGPLSSIGVEQMFGYVNGNNKSDKSFPDYEMLTIYSVKNSGALPTFMDALNFQDKYKQFLGNLNKQHDIGCC